MDRGTFEERLRVAAQRAVVFARQYVRQSLPDEVAFQLLPNRSYDGNPLVGDEEVFPADSLPEGQSHGPWSVAEAVGFLWRSGKVPEWIDVSVVGEDSVLSLI